MERFFALRLKHTRQQDTEDQYFNLNAVDNKEGTVGHVQFDGVSYDVHCVVVDGNAATIYLNDGEEYITVVDNGEGQGGVDKISDVLPVLNTEDICIEVLTPDVLNNVEGGNIQVHKVKELSTYRRRIK